MTTYNGRSANYVSGKEVPNKEPPMSKYVVEKLYKVHRERIYKIQPVVDCHVHIPSFLTNQTWKKNAEKSRKEIIRKENQDIYRRIEKMENEEGFFTKERREHIARVESKLRYLRKLKDHDRVVQILKRQKENEQFLKRIERAHPQYSIKKCEEWYSHHQHFKEGRRTDPTAGHIMHGMKGLMPTSLPPLTTRPNDLVSIGMELESQRHSIKSARLSSLSRDEKMAESIMSSLKSVNSSTVYTSDSGNHPRFALEETHPGDTHAKSSLYSGSGLKMHSHQGASGRDSSNHSHRRSSTMKQATDAQAAGRDSAASPRSKAGWQVSDETYVSSDSESGATTTHSSNLFEQSGDYSDLEGQGSHDLDDEPDSLHHLINASSMSLIGSEDLALIAQAPMVLTSSVTSSSSFSRDNKKCVIQIYSGKDYSEYLHLKVITSGISPQIVAQRTLTIDSAYDIINEPVRESDFDISEEDNLKKISEKLFSLFNQADADKSGFLTFSEFQQLMIKIDLGISVQEMRFIISEADSNETGVVDYHEFVPLAVDLVQSFRARNKAKNISSQEEYLLDEQILKSISYKDLQRTTELCLQKIHEVDAKRYGLIRTTDLKKCLMAFAGQAGLLESEIVMLGQLIPKDQFGRCKYNATSSTFFDTLSKVRFMTLKNSVLESRSSGLQKYLVELCQHEEEKNNDSGAPLTGILPSRVLVNLLSNSSKLSLSRMQVLVIISEASINEGSIDYYQVVPVVAKAIEIMMEPKALRQRAELIEDTDLSPEALLKGMTTKDFSKRVTALFRSYDVDKSGYLDQDEFVTCLQALDFHLSKVEMLALFDAADSKHLGKLMYEEFSEFLVHNLLNLEREKHLRVLHQSILQGQTNPEPPPTTNHGHSHRRKESSFEAESISDAIPSAGVDTVTLRELTRIFELADLKNTGFVHYEEFETILHELSFKIDSRFMVDTLRSEVHTSANGLVDYKASLNKFAALLLTLKSSENAKDEYVLKLKALEKKAADLALSMKEEIDHIVHYIKDKLKLLAGDENHGHHRFSEIYSIFHDPHSGLAKNESSLLMSKLLNTTVEITDHHRSKSTLDFDKRLISMAIGEDGEHKNSEKFHSTTHPLLDVDSGSGHLLHEGNKKGFPSKYKTDFTKEEVFSAVLEVRKLSILRSLITDDSDNASGITARIRELLKAAQAVLIAEKKLEDNGLIPVKACFSVLEQNRDFHLTRSQIMFIISFSDCFDKDHSFLNLEKFASHAATIIAQMNIMHEVRAEVLSTTSINDKKALQGWRLTDLESYLETELSRVADSNGDITSHTTLWETIKAIPKLKLTDIETTTIAAAFNSHSLNWKDILRPVLNTIRSLCRERLIQRRVHLLASAEDRKKKSLIHKTRTSQSFVNESKKALKIVAERLISLVKLAVHVDNIVLQFPTDLDDANKKGTTYSGGSSSSVASSNLRDSANSSAALMEDEMSMEENEKGEKMHLLFRGTRNLPMLRIQYAPLKSPSLNTRLQPRHKTSFQSPGSSSAITVGSISAPSSAGTGMAVGLNSSSSAAAVVASAGASSASSSTVSNPVFAVGNAASMMLHHGHSHQHKMERVESKADISVFLKIYAVEDTRMYSGMTLLAEITSADSKIAAVTPLPVKLPSLGLMDKESAEAFICNLVENIFIESENGAVSIKVKE